MNSPIPQRPNFDHIARAYRWLEYLSLGPVLERTRFHHLPQLVQHASIPRRALILGDGDGRFTARLLSADPQVTVDAIDLSLAMLALLENLCMASISNARARLRLHHRDALEYVASHPPQATYDLVVTHFFLDCLDQPEVAHLVSNLVPALSPGAVWLVSEFRIPTGILYWPARCYVRVLYLAFRILTGLRTTHLPDYAAELRNSGFRTIATHRALFGLLTTELWQLHPEPASATAPPQSAN